MKTSREACDGAKQEINPTREVCIPNNSPLQFSGTRKREPLRTPELTCYLSSFQLKVSKLGMSHAHAEQKQHATCPQKGDAKVLRSQERGLRGLAWPMLPSDRPCADRLSMVRVLGLNRPISGRSPILTHIQARRKPLTLGLFQRETMVSWQLQFDCFPFGFLSKPSGDARGALGVHSRGSFPFHILGLPNNGEQTCVSPPYLQNTWVKKAGCHPPLRGRF